MASRTFFGRRRLWGQVVLAVAIFFPNIFFENFARSRLWQTVDEFKRARAFVMRQPRTAEIDQFRFGHGRVGLRTTRAFGTSPHFSSGTGITPASRIAGWATMAFTSSREEMFSPPLTMMSFLRSTTSR